MNIDNNTNNNKVMSPDKSDEEIELIYDPILDCYIDPKTDQCYEVNDWCNCT